MERLPDDPDFGLSVPELITSKGYPVESHYVTTEDGYILNLFRIPSGRRHGQRSSLKPKPVVLLQHALQDSAFAWVCISPEESLAFALADAGYDVWLGNNRGNRYSTNHSFLSTSSAEFWEFSWDTMGSFDLPASINHVLRETGASKLGYVGHSQGSVQAFAGFSENQTLAKQVAIFVALGPPVFQSHIGGLWGYLGQYLGVMHAARALGIQSVLTNDGLIHYIAAAAYSMLPRLTSGVIDLICGQTDHLNVTRGPVLVDHVPAGTSVQNMAHWEQIAGTSDFKKFDHGSPMSNLAQYGVPEPPRYNLSAMSVPTALIVGGKDPLATIKDVRRLKKQLPQGAVYSHVELPSYGHLDFAWATDTSKYLQPHIFSALSHHLS